MVSRHWVLWAMACGLLPVQGLRAQDTLTYHWVAFADTLTRAPQPGQEASRLEYILHVAYPQFRVLPGLEHLASFNLELEHSLQSALWEGSEPRDWAEAASLAFEMYAATYENPDWAQPWEFSGRTVVRTNRPPLLVLEETLYSHTGGAHGLATTVYRNYDPIRDRQIVLSDLVDSTHWPGLQALFEANFYTLMELAPGSNLEEAGFWFEHNRFAMNQNMAFQPEGFFMLFNAYEVGPYTLGDIELFVPIEKLRPLLRVNPYIE